ncbi:MLO 11 [Micractinium conductrix]|uniref:MLO 11 n=1 Tax=Micractinium conductrix TaxID=554055 RepID=A0A2P6VK33_9CHLO|nr:MLO 11 [Micractinium conductrix]|eukprot:PSC74453.1 MLO 11 [Micractinium conductrix]
MVAARHLALAFGVPAGLYVTVVGAEVFSKQREERSLEELQISELAAAAAAVQAEKREQAAIQGLQASIQVAQQSVAQVEAEIEGVQRRLHELEQVKEARLKEAADVQGALEEAQGKLTKFVAEERRHRQAATAAEAALAAAHAATLEAKSHYNPLQHPLVPPAADAPAAPAAPAAAAAEQPAVDPADYWQPDMPEEKHPAKPTWRRGYKTYGKTEYMFCTLTPSDCTTRRLRPPKEWYDGLLGAKVAQIANFVVGATAPDGSQVSFLLKAHGYEYVKAEYYVQGGETKRMFREMKLQAGDGLMLELVAKHAGVPTTRLTIIPAARNPHAPAILASAAEQAAKRAERLAANPKGPKGAGAPRKRKKVGDEETDEEEEWEALFGPAATTGGRRSRQRSRKQFGDDFVSGLDEAWAAAARSDDDEVPNSDEDFSEGEKRRRRGDSRSAAASSGGASALDGVPEVVGLAEDRNVLKIKINRKEKGCDSLPGGGSSAGGGGEGEAKREPLALLSKKLLRDDTGAVTGAECRLGWEAGGRTALQLSRALSQFGAAHVDTTTVETFEVKPDDRVLELTLRLAPGAAGRGEALEAAIVGLLDAL